MTLINLTTPTALALSLSTLKAHLRLDGTEEDSLLTQYIDAATQQVEHASHTRLIQRTVRYVAPRAEVIHVPVGPLVSVESVTLKSAGGEDVSIPLAQVEVDTTRGTLTLLEGTYGLYAAAQVQLDIIVGFGADESAIPADLAQAVLMLASDMYQKRGAGEGGISPQVRALCVPYQKLNLSAEAV